RGQRASGKGIGAAGEVCGWGEDPGDVERIRLNRLTTEAQSSTLRLRPDGRAQRGFSFPFARDTDKGKASGLAGQTAWD
ncbi:MAG: hypothetical protein JJE15_16275, partial [Desulfobacteraceae bacterium]|nr:hypothetical protein [Desulfobacteraceae bacterium]